MPSTEQHPPTVRRILLSEWERTLAWTLIWLACISLVFGNRRLAASPYGTEEVAYLISGGFGALFMVTVAIFLLIAADLRDQRTKLDRVARAVHGIPAPDPQLVFSSLEQAKRPAGEADGASSSRAAPPERLLRRAGLAVGASLSVGSLVIVAGWRRAATTVDLSDALTGLVEAAIGLGLTVVALTALTMWMRHRVVRSMHDVLDAAGRGRASRVAVAEPDSSVDTEWTAPGLRRFHRRSCAALTAAVGEPLPVVPMDGDRTPCLLCHSEA
jgi:hypothetical protein